MEFRLIDSGIHTPSMNMAIDEALLASAMPVLRFYQWNPAGLSIGYAQPIDAINRQYCRKNRIGVVRRITGGNAVLHDDELTYSFIIDEKLMPKSIIESYKKISEGILAALAILGLDTSMNEEVGKGEKSPVCFYDPNWYEILVNGKKIVGSAQTRQKGKLLQHGAVLMDMDVEKYARCFTDYSQVMLERLNARVTTINRELGSPVDYRLVAKAMEKGFQKALNITFIPSEITQKEKTIAERINTEKYSTQAWNEKR